MHPWQSIEDGWMSVVTGRRRPSPFFVSHRNQLVALDVLPGEPRSSPARAPVARASWTNSPSFLGHATKRRYSSCGVRMRVRPFLTLNRFTPAEGETSSLRHSTALLSRSLSVSNSRLTVDGWTGLAGFFWPCAFHRPSRRSRFHCSIRWPVRSRRSSDPNVSDSRPRISWSRFSDDGLRVPVA